MPDINDINTALVQARECEYTFDGLSQRRDAVRLAAADPATAAAHMDHIVAILEQELQTVTTSVEAVAGLAPLRADIEAACLQLIDDIHTNDHDTVLEALPALAMAMYRGQTDTIRNTAAEFCWRIIDETSAAIPSADFPTDELITGFRRGGSDVRSHLTGYRQGHLGNGGVFRAVVENAPAKAPTVVRRLLSIQSFDYIDHRLALERAVKYILANVPASVSGAVVDAITSHLTHTHSCVRRETIDILSDAAAHLPGEHADALVEQLLALGDEVALEKTHTVRLLCALFPHASHQYENCPLSLRDGAQGR